MYEIEQLKKKTITDLKGIADNIKVKYKKDSKKDDIIKLILENQKVTETITQKKDELEEKNISSSFNQQPSQKPAQFDNIPDLPQNYFKDKIVFMIRDPHWGFVYWEITDNLLHNSRLFYEEKFLRVYDITDVNNPDASSHYFDIKISNSSNNWYINLPGPNRTFVVDYGAFKDGKFITILRSNIGSTPRDNVSDQLDQEWMMSDEYFKMMMNASGANQLFQQIGSQELMKFLAGNVNESLSSGIVNVSSGGLNLNSSLSSPVGGYSSDNKS